MSWTEALTEEDGVLTKILYYLKGYDLWSPETNDIISIKMLKKSIMYNFSKATVRRRFNVSSLHGLSAKNLIDKWLVLVKLCTKIIGRNSLTTSEFKYQSFAYL